MSPQPWQNKFDQTVAFLTIKYQISTKRDEFPEICCAYSKSLIKEGDCETFITLLIQEDGDCNTFK